jgi:hypothetical protein
MTSYEEVKNLYESNNKLELFEKKVKESCNVIMRQTDYDYDTSHEKLKLHNLSATSVIKEYMGIPEKKLHDKTTNQKMFGEFRKFLDDASKNYYEQRELREKMQSRIDANKK